MNLKTVDLEKELQSLKRRDNKKNLLKEAESLLEDAQAKDEAILENLQEGGTIYLEDESLLDPDRIYDIDQIRKICLKYRLRFLDSKVFKGDIPYEAITKIKQLEKESGQELQNFKIVAPKELFKLEDKDSDPLLFLELKDGRYYFIHKWGGELNRLRAFLAFPLRSFMHMFWFLAAVAVLFSMAIPTPSIDVFLFLTVHSFIAICGIACMLVFSLRENFSSVEWDSKYFS
jgi:hypothetical protein